MINIIEMIARMPKIMFTPRPKNAAVDTLSAPTELKMAKEMATPMAPPKELAIL